MLFNSIGIIHIWYKIFDIYTFFLGELTKGLCVCLDSIIPKIVFLIKSTNMQTCGYSEVLEKYISSMHNTSGNIPKVMIFIVSSNIFITLAVEIWYLYAISWNTNFSLKSLMIWFLMNNEMVCLFSIPVNLFVNVLLQFLHWIVPFLI